MGARFQGDALLAAASWVQMVLTGPLAVILAILGVAAVGLAMLCGKASPRQAAHVLFGCFIVFGSATIANELMALSHLYAAGEITIYSASTTTQSYKPPLKSTFVPTGGANPFDPYAQSPVQDGIGVRQ